MSDIQFNWSNVTINCLGGPRSKTNCEVQPRWKDGPQSRATDRKILRKAFGNYIIKIKNFNIAQLPGKNSLVFIKSKTSKPSCCASSRIFSWMGSFGWFWITNIRYAWTCC